LHFDFTPDSGILPRGRPQVDETHLCDAAKSPGNFRYN
jgi:hypothetical protein